MVDVRLKSAFSYTPEGSERPVTVYPGFHELDEANAKKAVDSGAGEYCQPQAPKAAPAPAPEPEEAADPEE